MPRGRPRDHATFATVAYRLSVSLYRYGSVVGSSWRVVCSVTLGGGYNTSLGGCSSPVRGVGIAVCEAPEMGVGGAYFTVTISAMPFPSIANAGISNQNHQTWPPGAKKRAAPA